MTETNLARPVGERRSAARAGSKGRVRQHDFALELRPRVVTWLTPHERTHVEAATNGHITLAHHASFQRVVSDVLTGLADAALFSAALIVPPNVDDLTKLIAGFPANPVIGLVLDANDRASVTGPLLLGQAGVRVVVDARSPAGLSDLRRVLDPSNLPPRLARRALDAIARELNCVGEGQQPSCDMSYGCRRFFSAIFTWRTQSAKQLAEQLGMRANTLGSRFFRASLPAPKRYLAFARLVLAAQLGECPGMTLSAIAERIDVSSPQSYHRHVRQYMGMSAREFRERFRAESMLEHFIATLVTPYRETLCTFDPLLNGSRRTVRHSRSTSRTSEGQPDGDVRAA